jgi:hypothetical protein
MIKRHWKKTSDLVTNESEQITHANNNNKRKKQRKKERKKERMKFFGCPL